MKQKTLKILGIDPGTTVSGYGLVEIRDNRPVIMQMGTLVPGRYSDHYQRLKYLHERALHLVEQYRPDVMAIEAPFYGKNVQSMLKLGRAQGVAMSAALHRSLPIYEYAPRKIKQSITGNGNASKEQVAGLLKSMLHIEELPADLDATDGLAAAVCHFYNCRNPQSNGNAKSWKDFIRKNPGRLKK